MSKTIRVDDDVYQALDEYRRKDQTFQDVIEEIAEEIGLLPSRIKDLDDLHNKLENLYGYDSEEISRIISALQHIYIGQEKESTIGIPHREVDSEYSDEVDTLQRLGLVKENYYTGKYDYGYRTTALGDRIGSEQIRNHIDEYADEIENILNSYDDGILSIALSFGFKRTDTGHLTTRGAELASPSDESLIDDQSVQQVYQELQERLKDIDIAVEHSDSSFVILPPEFRDYLKTLEINQTQALRVMDVYSAIRHYAVSDIDSRSELLDQLEVASEDDLSELVTELHEEGLTSRYIRRDEAPFLIKDETGLLSWLNNTIQDRLSQQNNSEPDTGS
jgi:predicted CopG family antitoxin